MNNALRGGPSSPQLMRQAELINQAIARSELPQDLTVYRGVGGTHLGDLRPGDTISDAAFSSTSYNPAISYEFIEDSDIPDPRMMVIHAPKGSPALILDNNNYWQQEVLFGSDQEFRVVKVESDTIHLEAVSTKGSSFTDLATAHGWRVIELVGDHKPPYDWKHGWIPVSPQAKKIAAARKAAGLPPGGTMPKAKAAPKADAGLSDDDLLNTGEADTAKLSDADFGRWLDLQRANPTKKSKKKAAPKKAKAAAKKTPAQVPTDADWSGSVETDGLSAEETQALNTWQIGHFIDDERTDTEGNAAAVGYYSVINAMARGADLPSQPDDDDLEAMDDMVAGMESALAKSRLTKRTVLYRGVTDLPDVAVGDTIEDSGWPATSLDAQMARDFANPELNPYGNPGESKVMVITAPAGHPALLIDTSVQREIVLGPGVPMRVTRIDGDEVHLEVV